MLKPITPREYFEGLDDPLDRKHVSETGRYRIRLVGSANVAVYPGIHQTVEQVTGVKAPAEGIFEVINLRIPAKKDECPWGFWASCQQSVYVAYRLLPSGVLLDISEVIGYIAAKAEEEEPESDPSLNRDRPLVAA